MSLLDHPEAASLRAAAADDLRLPLLAALAVAIGTASLTRVSVALLALALAAGLALAVRAGLRAALHRLLHVEAFLLVLLVMLPFTTAGRPFLHLGPLAATAEGMALALLVAAKVNTVALVLLALLGRASAAHLGRALCGLGAPERFVRLVDLLLRHSHTARDGLRRQSEAMRARGFCPRANLHSWRSYGHLIGGALLRAFDRAERVEEAIRMRGGHRPPAPLPPLPARDWLVLVLVVAVMAGLLTLDRLA